MSTGRVYEWTTDPTQEIGGRLSLEVVPLLRLDGRQGSGGLRGRHVRVVNAGELQHLDPGTGAIRTAAIGNAGPDAQGNFLFEPHRGGGRVDKCAVAEGDFRDRYVDASHFGEVNTYYHLDRIASYVEELLGDLGAPGLPPVTALVNAHHAATECDGVRDGVWNGERWRPFQGGHYRLPSRRYDIQEHGPISPDGEIHLGPGYRLLDAGALVARAGSRYRANASHNAGTLYHEYGHHITRHTADFRANALRAPDRQNNRKSAIDEGTSDYWAAALLGVPHIWAWHKRHDHPRNLASSKTMDDYDHSRGADAHANGTIWAAALWDLRTRMQTLQQEGARRADRLVLHALRLIGTIMGSVRPATPRSVRRARNSYGTGLAALLRADAQLHAGLHRDLILAAFARRHIHPVESQAVPDVR